jgi:hypothetical protein
MSFDIASLTARESWWDTAGVWLSLAVALGVAMESVTTFDSLANWLRLNTLERYGLRHGISKVGFLILTVALALEVDAAIQSHDISEQIIAGLNDEIQVTQRREQELITQSNAIAAELKYRTTDRTIVIQRVAEKLAAYKGTPFALTISDDPDAIQLVGKIADALERAGWIWKDNKPSDNSFEFVKHFGTRPTMRISPAHGIIVNVPVLDGTRLGLAGDALADALKGENLRDVEDQQLGTVMMTAEKKIYGVVHLTIGVK